MPSNRLAERFSYFQPLSCLVRPIASFIAAYQQFLINTSSCDTDFMWVFFGAPKKRATTLVTKPAKAAWRRGIFGVSLQPQWRRCSSVRRTRQRPGDLRGFYSNPRADQATSPFAALSALTVMRLVTLLVYDQKV